MGMNRLKKIFKYVWLILGFALLGGALVDFFINLYSAALNPSMSIQVEYNAFGEGRLELIGFTILLPFAILFLLKSINNLTSEEECAAKP